MPEQFLQRLRFLPVVDMTKKTKGLREDTE